MADNDTGTTPPAGKSKSKRTPLPYELLDVETIKSLLARADKLPADTVVYVRVQSPPNVRQDKPLRKDFERGVLAELENGKKEAIDIYNDRRLCVAQVGPSFRYKSAVKEEVIRKVTVQKV